MRCRLEDSGRLECGSLYKTSGKSKITCMEGVRNDMKKLSLHEHITLDRREWRQRIHVNDHQR